MSSWQAINREFVVPARKFEQDGKFEEAIQLLLRGREKHPSDGFIRLCLGELYTRHNQLRAAIDELEYARSHLVIEMYREMADVQLRRARRRLRTGQILRALGRTLRFSGRAIQVVAGIISLYLDMRIVAYELGFLGVVFGLILFPVMLALAPIYAAAVLDFWLPLIIGAVALVLSIPLVMIGTFFTSYVEDRSYTFWILWKDGAELLEEFYAEAVVIPSSERPHYLESKLQRYPDLRSELEELLAASDASKDFLESPIEVLFGLGDDEAPSILAFFPTIPGFRILYQAGEGGMGIVYAAEQEHPRRIVALKIQPTAGLEPKLLRRFEAEADKMAILNHPGIPSIYTYGTIRTEFGATPYFAMEWVSGMDLIEYVKRQACDPRRRLSLFQKICEAVSYAHEHNIVHRDLKPRNILVTDDGEPKILDFGIARFSNDSGAADGWLTTTGKIVGTPKYMSPEQASGTPVDHRSDIYTLGVILYEMLADRLPYDFPDETSSAILETIRSPFPIRISGPPFEGGDGRPIRELLARALQKAPERRYPTLSDLLKDLGQIRK